MTAIVCGMAYMVTACQQQEEIEAPSNEVVFSAATSYTNDTETRTIYSGQEFNATTQPIERIDWVANTDKIRVLNVTTGQAANYTVGAPTASNEKSVASVTADAARLTWGSGSTNTFYAVYPSTAMNASNVIGATIPVSQSQTENHPGKSGATVTNPTMNQYAYMVAKVTANNGQTVVLPFEPAMTAFEFYLGIEGINATVTSFEMTSTTTALTGAWSWNGTSFTCPSFSAGTNDKITVNFPSGTTITPSAPLRFTVFALPQNLENITLKFVLSSGTVTLPISGKTFIGGKKYRITTPTLDWIYKVDEIDDQTYYGHDPKTYNFNVKSYRYHSSNPSYKEAVTWKLKYSTDGGTSWADVDQNGATSSTEHTITLGNTGTGVGTANYAAGEPREANIVGQAASNVPGNNTIAAIRADLRTRSPRGTENAPWDLSMHDIYGNNHTMTTANSYVVDRPGWYMFPVVYGNGITNGTKNPDAYRPGESGDSRVTLGGIFTAHQNDSDFRYFRDFFDAAGGGINDPRIMTSYAAWTGVVGQDCTPTNVNTVIVWQNSMTSVTENGVTHGEPIVTSDPTLVDVSVNTGAYNFGTIKYIKFQIKPEDIQPGNIVIAFRGTVTPKGLSANTILWSWQIWVTQVDLTPVTVGSNAFMPRNLGAVDKTDADLLQYADRNIMYKVVQTDGNGNERTIGIHTGDDEVFAVEEIGDAQQVEANQGNNPFYQWGRKDPMVPVNPDGTNAVTTIYAPTFSNYASIINVGDTGNANVTYAIQNPHRLCHNPTYATWIGGSDKTTNPNKPGTTLSQFTCLPYNLWNSAIWKTMDAGGSDKYKTIYDPCPPGFCVPNVGAVSSFSTATPSSKGTVWKSSSDSLYFPLTGLRTYHPGTFDTEHVGSSGHFWTDCPEDVNSDWDDHTNMWPVRWELAKVFTFNHTTVFIPRYDYFHPSEVSQTRGTAHSIRPMVDPKYAASSSPSPSAAPRGNINSFNNGGEIPE